MSKPISWSLQMNVRSGQLDDARKLMKEMVESTSAEKESHCYEWFLSADGKTCHILERYADSDAVMAHLGTFGTKFAERFLGCFEPTSLFVYGEPRDDVRKALDGFGAVYLGTLGGFRR